MRKVKGDSKKRGIKRREEVDQEGRFDEEPEEQRRNREEEAEEKE
jgi:hypothetical protein